LREYLSTFLFLILALNRFAGAQPVPIIDLHCNDEQGLPAEPYEIGTEVTIAGIVTVGTRIFSSIRTEAYVQDETGGIFLYRSDVLYDAELGDSLIVVGEIGQQNGTTLLVPSLFSVVGTDLSVPVARLVTCSTIAEAFGDDFCEPDESRLVRVEGVFYDESTGMITDETGCCRLTIDSDTGIEIVTGSYDITGVIKQWDTTEPYTEAYELLPRFQSDIVVLAGPEFIDGPREHDITSSGFSVSWTTDVPATSRLLYGFQSPGDLGAVEDTALTTEHMISLESLDPATIYYLQAVSQNEEGESRSTAWYASTASGYGCTGSIAVHFTQSVESQYATGDPANGNANLERRLLDRINGAHYSIDACLFTLTVPAITTALISAKNRGVQVRVIYESDNFGAEFGRLEDNGIPILNDEAGPNSGGGFMHNKFFVFDYLDRSLASDDYVWAGSANISYSGFNENAENVIVIQDQALAGAYTAEFEEMWGGSGPLPVEDQARFGSLKQNNTPHYFQIGDRVVELHMSPSDDVTATLVELVSTADRGIYFCIYNFTSTVVEDALLDLFDGYDVRVAGVFDSNQAGSSSRYWPMSGEGPGAWDPPADVHLLEIYDSMHHKYMLVDTDNEGWDGTIWTGSFNWTWSAESVHDENVLILYAPEISNLYLQEFMARYHEAGGSDSLALGSVAQERPSSLSLRIGPNPLRHHPYLTVTMPGLVEVEIYDLTGRRVFWREPDKGKATIRIPRSSFHSGSYIAAVRGPQGRTTQPFVCLLR
jgi:phosphatidylserine/phosphatidylglycerophosphate/cardiolipin synthase-like enzyme